MWRYLFILTFCVALAAHGSARAQDYGANGAEWVFESVGEESLCDYCDLPNACGVCEPRRPCCCQSDECYWVRAEFLQWWTRGMQTPPLASASPPGTPLIDAGVLGTPGATVLFGGDDSLLNNRRSGVRLLGGGWLDCSKQLGLEADYLDLRTISEKFSAESDGSDIISRPFRNAVTGVNDAELVSYPGILRGRVTVTAKGDFQSAGGRLRWNLGCEDLGCGDVLRWHLLTGYRFSRLSEKLIIREELESLDPLDPGSFDLHDRFRTSNDFHGGELGMVMQVRKGRWDCELLGRLGLGDVEQNVAISGDTVTNVSGVTDTFTGGLLAQRTNIGNYERHRFAVIPEIGVTMGYRLSEGWSASFGYSLIVWNRVVRAGNQIDSVVDPRLIPPEIPLVPDATRPGFAFRESIFWAQGVNLGLSYRW